MRAPLVRVTIGDYLYRMPGFLENVSINIDQTYSWEIKDGLQLPHAAIVNITFKPILDQIPRRATLDTTVPKLLANGKGIIHNSKDVEVADRERVASIADYLISNNIPF
jgi:hypothetical protein